MDNIKQTAANASLDNIAEMWVKILLAQIREKKEQEKTNGEKGQSKL